MMQRKWIVTLAAGAALAAGLIGATESRSECLDPDNYSKVVFSLKGSFPAECGLATKTELDVNVPDELDGIGDLRGQVIDKINDVRGDCVNVGDATEDKKARAAIKIIDVEPFSACAPEAVEPPDCSFVLCLNPVCGDDEIKVVPEGECCPVCVPA